MSGTPASALGMEVPGDRRFAHLRRAFFPLGVQLRIPLADDAGIAPGFLDHCVRGGLVARFGQWNALHQRVDERQPHDALGEGLRERPHERPTEGMADQHLWTDDARLAQCLAQVGDDLTGGARTGRRIAPAAACAVVQHARRAVRASLRMVR